MHTKKLILALSLFWLTPVSYANTTPTPTVNTPAAAPAAATTPVTPPVAATAPATPPAPITISTPPDTLVNIDPATSTVTRVNDKLYVKVVDPTTGQEVTTIYNLELMPKGKPFFHWTTEGTPDRWMSQGGKMLPDELNWLDSPGTGMQAYGPGWYVSANPVDSHSFGVQAIEQTTPQDFWVLSGTNFRPVDAATAHATEKLLNAQDVVGTKATNTWYTIFDPRQCQNMHPMSTDDALDALLKTYVPIDPNNQFSVFGAGPSDILSVLDIKPHPFYDKYFPEIQHLALHQKLTAEEMKKIVGYAQNDFSFSFSGIGGGTGLKRKIFQLLDPSQRTEFMLQIVPNNSANLLGGLLSFEQNVGSLPPDDELTQAYPSLKSLFANGKLKAADRAALVKILPSVLQSTEINVETPLVQKIRTEFANEIRDYFMQSAATNAAQGTMNNQVIRFARGWGIPLSAFSPNARDPGVMLTKEAPPLPYDSARGALDGDGKDLLDSFQFTDNAEILHALANGNNAPWTLHEVPGKDPLITRWHETMAKKHGGEGDMYARFVDQPAVTYRDLPLSAGGNIVPNGSKDGYLRVSTRQLKVLESNPLLVVHSIPDPNPPIASEKSFLVRYDFPSVATYKKFSSLLSPQLVTDLQAAESAGKLADPTSADARALTARITQELSNTTQGDTQAAQYVYRVSVQAYPEENDLFSRLMVNKQLGLASFAPGNFDDALLVPVDELNARAAEGQRRLTVLANALKKAHDANPTAPNYASVPELYEDYFPSVEAIGDPAKYQAAARNYFTQNPGPTNLEDGKWDFLMDCLDHCSATERKAAVLSLVQSNVAPITRTQAEYDRLLQDSLEIAHGPQKQQVARWWLSLAAGDNPPFAKSLSVFLEKLPADLHQSFEIEYLMNGGRQLALPFSKAYLSKLNSDMLSVYKHGASDADKAVAARFLIAQSVKNAGDEKAADALLAKILPDYLKEKSGPSVVAALLQNPDPKERARYARAFLELPKNSLDDLSRGTVLNSILTLAPNEQKALLRVGLDHPEHWINAQAWKTMAAATGSIGLSPYNAGNQAITSLLLDPTIEGRLHEELMHDPARIKIWSALVGGLPMDGDNSQIATIKYLVGQKQWTALKGILKQSQGQISMWRWYGDPGTKLTATVTDSLQQMAKDSAGDQAIAYYYQSLIAANDPNNPTAAADALVSMYKALPNSDQANTKYIVSNLISTFQMPRWDITTNKMTNTIAANVISDTLTQMENAGASDAVLELFAQMQSKPKLVESLRDNAALGQTLATNIGKLDEAARRALVDRLTRMNGAIGDSLISAIIANKDLAGMNTLETLLRDPNYRGPRWKIISQGLASTDVSVKNAFALAMADAHKHAAPSAAEVDQMAALSDALNKNSYAALNDPQFANISDEHKTMLRAEYDRSLPHKARMKITANTPCPAAFATVAAPVPAAALAPTTGASK